MYIFQAAVFINKIISGKPQIPEALLPSSQNRRHSSEASDKLIGKYQVESAMFVRSRRMLKLAQSLTRADLEESTSQIKYGMYF